MDIFVVVTLYRKYLVLLLLCLYPFLAGAQQIYGSRWGANAGLIAALGNRFQRVGLTLQGYYTYGHGQANAEVRLYRNYRNLGPRIRYNELVTSLGLLAGWGDRRRMDNPFLSVVGNQTGYSNSIGYAYNLYLNKIGTTQRTGTIALQFGSFSILSENDIFARATLDRYRTGAFLLQYQHLDKYQLALNCTMWTGEMGTNKVTNDKDFPFAAYMDTTGGRYTQYSHGLLSGQFKTVLPAYQAVQASAGIDAEKVRNAIQNRVMHDMPFLPRKWRNPKNCHIPMVDTAGNPYLYRKGQQVRKPELYWNAFSGAALFY